MSDITPACSATRTWPSVKLMPASAPGHAAMESLKLMFEAATVTDGAALADVASVAAAIRNVANTFMARAFGSGCPAAFGLEEWRVRIGIDLGGTKIEIAALDERGEFLARRRRPTPAGDYPGILDAVVSLVSEVEREFGAAASIGIGIPGSLSPSTGLVRNANSTVLIGKALDRDLTQRLQRPVRIANDANCFVLSEARDGAASDSRVVFGVILGTGVGGGITVGGELLEGRNRIAGEWGHTPLPRPEPDEYPGPLCYCGRYGCIETFLCGPRLQEQYRDRTGRDRDPRDIDAAATAGDAAAEAVLVRYEDRLARGLAAIIDILDPDVIVLGGGLSNMNRLYANLPPLLLRHAFLDTMETPLKKARFGDSSGVKGAAQLSS
jgi:fructokinase